MASMKWDSQGLERLQKAIKMSAKMRARVGIFGDKNARSRVERGEGITNAEVGQRMEFGGTFKWAAWKALTGREEIHVPARSFLRMPLRDKKTRISAAMKSSAILLTVKGLPMLFMRLGAAGLSIVTEAFATRGFGTWSPNHPLVIKMKKGGDSPLIDTGTLQRSISYQVVGGGGK